MKPIFLVVAIGLSFGKTLAQEEDLSSLFKVDYDTPLTIDLEEEEEEEMVVAKKKVKRNFFFGYKTRKGYTRTVSGREAVFEQFNTLKVYQGPSTFTRDFYWFHSKKKKIINSLKVDVKYAAVLHGPYLKTMGDLILEEGYFYKGMKHKRWMRHNTHDILQEKKYFWKGWPQESLLSYYDFERTKLREIIPVHFGEKEGEYWGFHANGNTAARGRFKFDNKVGTWREYYPNKRVKREVLYPEDPFNFEHKAVILREWDTNGKLIYDREDFLESLK